MAAADADPFASFKAAQREAWSLFAPVAVLTTIPAAKLVKFAQVAAGQRVLDVACGTGVVAVTAARRSAKVSGLDLSPVLLERARQNATTAGVAIEFVEGDAEALPYPDASFDVVLSQFGHIFAPRPAIVVREMLRVLRPGGRIAFSAWPPELLMGQQFTFVEQFSPAAPGTAQPPSPALWGDPHVIEERLGAAVSDLAFERGTMIVPSLSPQHSRRAQEATCGLLAKIVSSLADDPAKLARFRAEYEARLGEVFEDNALRAHFIMARAVKA